MVKKQVDFVQVSVKIEGPGTESGFTDSCRWALAAHADLGGPGCCDSCPNLDENLDRRVPALGMLVRSGERMGVTRMPHQGTQLAIWILMCLGLALIWIVTILLVRSLIGGRRRGRATDAASTRGGEAAHYEPEPRLGHLDNIFTSPERDSYRRRG